MQTLFNLQPAPLWKHFAALSAIPRVSKNERAAGDYVLNFATKLGLKVERDDAGNIMVQKPAAQGCSDRAAVVLQGHLDMVGQKISGSTHDFDKDPIRLLFDGQWVHAEGTTLGADNGIGVSAILSILESTHIKHGPLTALFTVEEEIGLLGAAKIKPEFIPGEILINLDGASPEELIVGCAGASDVRAEIPCDRQPFPSKWTTLRVHLSGLLGGHSGADIHRGRANALKVIARLLSDSAGELDWRLISMSGGDARNAIPREAVAEIALHPEALAPFQSSLRAMLAAVRHELAHSDPGLTLAVSSCPAPEAVVTAKSSQRLIDFLRACPNGVLRFSDTHTGVVETSNNLAVLSLGKDGPACVQCLVRSLSDSAKLDTAETICGLARLAEGEPLIYGNYPGWEPSADSRITPLIANIAGKVLGKTPRIAVIHAGLECGIIRSINPRLDCISFGAAIEAMHSPDERVHAGSVAKFYSILAETLGSLPIKL
ncbi:MAG: aminoacyl-histidine dipeptidase [Opitutaceae bacterium]|jgi:dipeptidase D